MDRYLTFGVTIIMFIYKSAEIRKNLINKQHHLIVRQTISRSLGRQVARSSGRSVVRSLSRPVAQSSGRSVVRSLGRPVAWSLGRTPYGRSVVRSLGPSVALSYGRSVVRSLVPPKERLTRSLQHSNRPKRNNLKNLHKQRTPK